MIQISLETNIILIIFGQQQQQQQLTKLFVFFCIRIFFPSSLQVQFDCCLNEFRIAIIWNSKVLCLHKYFQWKSNRISFYRNSFFFFLRRVLKSNIHEAKQNENLTIILMCCFFSSSFLSMCVVFSDSLWINANLTEHHSITLSHLFACSLVVSVAVDTFRWLNTRKIER